MMMFYNELSIQLTIHQWGFSHSGLEPDTLTSINLYKAFDHLLWK